MSDGPDDPDGRIRTAVKSRGRGLLLGLTGGFVATVSMSAFREPTARAYPPTAKFWAKFVSGEEPEDHPLPAIVLHLLYGTLAGGAFGLLVGTSENREVERSLHLWTVLGAGYGLVLSELGLHLLLEGLNDQDVQKDERFLFHLGHLVYGLTLGAWCGFRDRE